MKYSERQRDNKGVSQRGALGKVRETDYLDAGSQKPIEEVLKSAAYDQGKEVRKDGGPLDKISLVSLSLVVLTKDLRLGRC